MKQKKIKKTESISSSDHGLFSIEPEKILMEECSMPNEESNKDISFNPLPDNEEEIVSKDKSFALKRIIINDKTGEIIPDYAYLFEIGEIEKLKEYIYEKPLDRESIFRKILNEHGIDNLSKLVESIYPKEYTSRIINYFGREKELSENEIIAISKLIKMPLKGKITTLNKNDSNKILKNNQDNLLFIQLFKLINGYLKHLHNKSKNGYIYLNDLATNNNITSLNVLLVGPPGCGKSYIPQVIGDLFNIPVVYIDCASNDYIKLAGSASNWKDSKESVIATELINKDSFPLILVFDEVDKGGYANDHLIIDTINKIIDPNIPFVDAFFEVPIYHKKSFIFILTANYRERIPKYIDSRVIVIEVESLKGKVMIPKLMDKFSKQFKISSNLINKILSNNQLKEGLINMVDKYKFDFRQLECKLELAYYSALGENDETNIEESFLSNLKNILESNDKEKNKHKPAIGFLR